MTTTVERRKLKAQPGAPVVLVEGIDDLWHLPGHGNGRSLCGLRGLAYVYSELVARRRLCLVCAGKAPAGDVYTADGGFAWAPRPRRKVRTRVRQLTDAQATVLYRTYVDKNVGVSAIAQLVWLRLGYSNEVSCANAIYRAFALRGHELRSAGESRRRTPAGRRLLGFGGQRDGERVLDARTIDRLHALYAAGYSVPDLSKRFHRRFGYDATRFRWVLEYAWKSCGYRLRNNSEAELLARSRLTKRCAGRTSGADGRRPRSCTQRPLDDSEFCLHHDPRHRDAVLERAARLRARKVLAPKIAWDEVVPHLEPLLQPRPDRFGRRLEGPGGALARHTGVDPAICSRLLKGKHPEITHARANQLLAPLGLTVNDVLAVELLAAA